MNIVNEQGHAEHGHSAWKIIGLFSARNPHWKTALPIAGITSFPDKNGIDKGGGICIAFDRGKVKVGYRNITHVEIRYSILPEPSSELKRHLKPRIVTFKTYRYGEIVQENKLTSFIEFIDRSFIQLPNEAGHNQEAFLFYTAFNEITGVELENTH